MDRRLNRQLEGTAKPTGKAGKAGLKPWDLKLYEYKELKGDQRLPHRDPRLEAELQSYDRHQEQFDSDFSSSDADHEYGLSVSSSSFTPQLYARTSTASELGTLAGCFRRPKTKSDKQFTSDASGSPIQTTPTSAAFGSPFQTTPTSDAFGSPINK
jgi:hypothetical protein